MFIKWLKWETQQIYQIKLLLRHCSFPQQKKRSDYYFPSSPSDRVVLCVFFIALIMLPTKAHSLFLFEQLHQRFCRWMAAGAKKERRVEWKKIVKKNSSTKYSGFDMFRNWIVITGNRKCVTTTASALRRKAGADWEDFFSLSLSLSDGWKWREKCRWFLVEKQKGRVKNLEYLNSSW